jgi:hypothetical protein
VVTPAPNSTHTLYVENTAKPYANVAVKNIDPVGSFASEVFQIGVDCSDNTFDKVYSLK